MDFATLTDAQLDAHIEAQIDALGVVRRKFAIGEAADMQQLSRVHELLDALAERLHRRKDDRRSRARLVADWVDKLRGRSQSSAELDVMAAIDTGTISGEEGRAILRCCRAPSIKHLPFQHEDTAPLSLPVSRSPGFEGIAAKVEFLRRKKAWRVVRDAVYDGPRHGGITPEEGAELLGYDGPHDLYLRATLMEVSCLHPCRRYRCCDRATPADP